MQHQRIQKYLVSRFFWTGNSSFFFRFSGLKLLGREIASTANLGVTPSAYSFKKTRQQIKKPSPWGKIINIEKSSYCTWKGNCVNGSSCPSAIPLAICCGIDVHEVKESTNMCSLISLDKLSPKITRLVSKDMGLQSLNLRQCLQKCKTSVQRLQIWGHRPVDAWKSA